MSVLVLTLAVALAAPRAAAPPQLSHDGGLPLSFQVHVENLGQAPGVAPPAWPRTVAEASGFLRSSRLDEVVRFLGELDALPHAERLSRRSIGTTTEGRDLVAVTVSAPDSDPAEGRRPRASVIVNANIHGGEIEGKVAVQILLREFALGYHGDILEALDVTFVPVFNADGNDRIARTNRVTQNGPDGGVGERPNAMGLDLNRDFVKLESPEAQALTRLANELRPIAFMDLHTTNGSDHGYDLTYAPSLSPNAAPSLDAYARERLFPVVRAKLGERDGIQIFDYGNFGYAPRERGSRGDRGDPVRWSTYDSRPRFGTNLMGLRDTVSILSEAYSYVPYERRIHATYGFVLECLRTLARDRSAVERAIEGAARSRAVGGAPWTLGVDAQLADGPTLPVRTREIGSVMVDLDPREPGEQQGRRRVAGPLETVRTVDMQVQVAFEAGRRVDPGAAWLVPDPSDALLRLLELHTGAAPRRLDDPVTLEVGVFVVEEAERAGRPFQGHRETRVRGRWVQERVELPPGTAWVPSTPLTAHLLHPESDDSFTTWNLFDPVLFDPDADEVRHPALRAGSDALASLPR